jgi:hypothetical protein
LIGKKHRARDNLKDPGIEGRIILKLTGFIWLRIGTDVGLF